MLTSYQPMSRPVELFPKSLFSVGEAAAYLGVSATTVRRRIAAGALRAQRWGRSWIMWRADLDGYYQRFTHREGEAGGGST
jgi:excisionase family DNA binding protein